MNKKIKIIDLLIMLNNKEKMPKKIRVANKYEFIYDEVVNAYFSTEIAFASTSLIQHWLNNANKLNSEVEILEDNTEEDNTEKIKELPDNIDEIGWFEVKEKINELIRAVKRIKKG